MRVDTPIQVNIPISSSGKSESKVFSDLQKGDMVNARVLNVDGNEVILKTSDGTVLRAEFTADNPVKPGDTLQLMLASQGEKSISLKLVAVNNEPIGLNVTSAEATLIRIGVEPSPTNIRLAQILQNDGILPNAKNILNLSRIAAQYPDMNARLATFMAENNIAPTKQNVDALMQIVQNPKGFSNDLQALTQFASHQISNNGVATQVNTATFANSFISALFVNTKTAQTAQQIVSQPDFTSFMEKLQAMPKDDVKTAIRNFVNNSNIPAKQEAVAILTLAYTEAQSVNDGAKGAVILQNSQGKNIAADNNNVTVSKGQENLAQVTQGEGKIASTIEQNKNSVVYNNDKGNLDENITSKAVTSNSTVKSDVNNNISAKSTNTLVGGNTSQESNNIGATVSTTALQNSDTPLTTAVKLLNALNKLFTTVRNDNPQQMGNEIKESLKNQLDLLSNIKANTAKISGETSPLSARADSALFQATVANNFDNFYYCQVPFEFKSTKNSAELFVFEKNKDNKDTDKTNVTILIALETQNIGRIETVLRSESNVLNLEIRVQNENIKKYIEYNTQELTDSLKKVNFDTKKIEVKIMEEITTPLNAHNIINEEKRVILSGIDIQV